MALGLGSIVLQKFTSVVLPGTGTGPSYTPSPPHFGIVTAAGPPLVVLWDTGEKNTIPVAGVDDLYAVASATRQAYLGQVVRLASESPEYQYLVVALYRRGSSVATELAMLQTLDGKAYREVPISQLLLIVGR